MNARIMMVLHSHIPYVKRQGRWPFGEVWLFEAMAETYIPLLINLLKLHGEGKVTPITMSFSPVLLEQLNSKYIKQEFISYLKERENMARADERYYLAQSNQEFARIAAYYASFYRDIRRDYEIELNRDIIQALRYLKSKGHLEIITTAATHAYIPLLDRTSLESQIYWGKRLYEQVFSMEPQGFWLPECGYFQGIEDVLIENGFNYFFVDSHAIEGGKPLGAMSPGGSGEEVEIETFASTGLSTYRPYRIENRNITVFGRNSMVSQQVWSADYGYPGDEDYREFHKSSDKSGFKYWRVTNRNQSIDKKQPYDPDAAQLKVKQHAAHFVSNLENTGRHAVEIGFNHPLIVGCYDTELFGHWWWEGINWLSEVFNCIHNSTELELVLPSQVEPATHQAKLFESSWGMGGKHYVWENEETSWMWDIIRKAGEEYQSLKGMEQETLMGQRAMSQAIKELMLIQSSDWLFMVSNNSTRDYALKRFYEHYTKLLRLTHTVRNQQFDDSFKEWLRRIQYEDDFFSCL